MLRGHAEQPEPRAPRGSHHIIEKRQLIIQQSQTKRESAPKLTIESLCAHSDMLLEEKRFPSSHLQRRFWLL